MKNVTVNLTIDQALLEDLVVYPRDKHGDPIWSDSHCSGFGDVTVYLSSTAESDALLSLVQSVIEQAREQ